MPSAGLRRAGEGAFLVLLALGLVLARFDLIVIVVVLAVAAVLVALLDRAGSRRAARSRTPEEHPDELPAAPPHLESSKREKAPRRRPRLPKAAPPPRQPEPEPASAEPPREWNVWELERAVRDAGDGERQEEWGALLIYLREFANAGGDLPPEFDGLVRESFGEVLAEPTRAAAS